MVLAVSRPQYPPPALLEPSWYPDPTGRYEARYWDGRHWTSHISHYGATGTDPLIRARLDRFWIRWFGRVALWGALALVGYWAYQNYWPSDDRDLSADQGLANGAALLRFDVPANYTPGVGLPLSPLTVPVPDEGEIFPVGCQPLQQIITDGGDEPSDSTAFANDLGGALRNTIVVGANPAFSANYLAALREPDAGQCLAELWIEQLVAQRPNATVTGVSVRAMANPAFGDDAVWWRLSATIEGEAFPLGVFADVLFVSVDRVVSEYTFEGLIEAVGVDVQRDVIRPHTTEIAAALERTDGAVEDESNDSDDDTGG